MYTNVEQYRFLKAANIDIKSADFICNRTAGGNIIESSAPYFKGNAPQPVASFPVWTPGRLVELLPARVKGYSLTIERFENSGGWQIAYKNNNGCLVYFNALFLLNAALEAVLYVLQNDKLNYNLIFE